MGGSFEVVGLEQAIAVTAGKATRAGGLGPALKLVARELEKRVDDAYRDQRSPAGEVWPELAPSTIAARARSGKVAKRRDASGNLTSAAVRRRALVTGNIAPMVDTGRLRASQHADVTGTAIEWSEVGYGAPHITGSSKGLPKRNMSVFERVRGAWQLEAKMAAFMRNALARFISRGAV